MRLIALGFFVALAIACGSDGNLPGSSEPGAVILHGDGADYPLEAYDTHIRSQVLTNPLGFSFLCPQIRGLSPERAQAVIAGFQASLTPTATPSQTATPLPFATPRPGQQMDEKSRLLATGVLVAACDRAAPAT